MKHFIEPPEAIIVTFGQQMMTRGGKTTAAAFERFFITAVSSDDSYWQHKSRNKPVHDVAYVYIIMDNYIVYRAQYAGYQKGESLAGKPLGEDGEEVVKIEWPRIILCGPLFKAPEPIPMQGFQGFRYSKKLF